MAITNDAHDRWFRRAIAPAAILCVLVASACSSGSSGGKTSTGSTAAAKAKNSNITIGFLPEQTTDPFFVTMHYGAEQEAKVLGVKLDFQGTTGTPTASAQIPYVQAVLAQHPSAIVLGAADETALIPSVQQAKSAGIPVVTVDNPVTETSLLDARITGDNVGGGELAAKLIDQAVGGKGSVYVITGSTGEPTLQERQQGFQEGVKTYPGLQFAGYQYTNNEASIAATDTEHVLSRYPSLAGIFAIDSFVADGVVEGLSAAHKIGKVKVVSYDAEPSEVAELRAGQVSALVAQRAAVEGALGVLYAYDEVKHDTQSVKDNVIMSDILLTTSNLSADQKWFYCTSLSSCHTTWQPTVADGAP